jgi:hypothetical protein
VSTALDIVIAPESALQVFTAPEGMQPYLQTIRSHIDGFQADVSTRKGRELIASNAYKVAKIKAYLDRVGKELADEQKEIPKRIDASRKRVRDTLTAWQDEVRQPLTAWEEAEQARISTAKAWITSTLAMLSVTKLAAPVDIGDMLDALIAEDVTPERFAEFAPEAADAKARAVAHLQQTLAEAMQREKDEAELARLRAEQAERDRIAAEQAEADAARQREAEAADAARQKAEADAAAAVAEAQRREREAQEAAARAERDRIAAEERAARAEQEARDQAAREVAEAAAREQAEQRKREADKEHRRGINRAAVDAMVANGIAEACAIQAVSLIATGRVPAVSIRY